MRHGVCNLFLVTEPLAGWRQVTVSDRRTRIDWAHCIKDLVDVHYPDAEQIVLVQDNLNTHTPASLYEAFPPAEAKRLADRLVELQVVESVSYETVRQALQQTSSSRG